MHSLAHLLVTAMSLECGYPASAIRERVYAGAAGSGEAPIAQPSSRKQASQYLKPQ